MNEPKPRDPIDYEKLTPGIRVTVMLLRRWGFDTTDSGDGVTNVAAGMEGAMDVPMVVIRVEPSSHLVQEAKRLRHKLDRNGVTLSQNGRGSAEIQASYDPVNDVAILILLGVSDETIATGLSRGKSSDGPLSAELRALFPTAHVEVESEMKWDDVAPTPTEKAWREWHQAKGLDCHDGGETLPEFGGEDMHPTEEEPCE